MNDVLVTTAARCLLVQYGINPSPHMHIRCVAHVINLVVQAFLHGMDEADDPNITDYFEINKDMPIHYNVDEDEDQLEMENEELKESDFSAVDDFGEDIDTEIEKLGKSPVKRVSFYS